MGCADTLIESSYHNDTKQAKQSEIQPGRIPINVYYSIIFHRCSTKWHNNVQAIHRSPALTGPVRRS